MSRLAEVCGSEDQWHLTIMGPCQSGRTFVFTRLALPPRLKLHNMVNFSLLVAEIGPVVWGTPANFNGFRILAALLHGSQVVGVSQTLRH